MRIDGDLPKVRRLHVTPHRLRPHCHHVHARPRRHHAHRHPSRPQAAVVPVMKRKTFKALGTPTAQAKELEHSIKDLSPEELLALARARRVELEAAGEVDRVHDVQPSKAPIIDASFVGTQLEVCWRYWRDPDPENPKEAGKKRVGEKMWCEATVVEVADGKTTFGKIGKEKKQLLKPGAVRLKWPADAAFKEEESFSWHVLQAPDWRSTKHLGWRYTKEQLAKLRSAEEPPEKRQKA